MEGTQGCISANLWTFFLLKEWRLSSVTKLLQKLDAVLPVERFEASATSYAMEKLSIPPPKQGGCLVCYTRL